MGTYDQSLYYSVLCECMREFTPVTLLGNTRRDGIYPTECLQGYGGYFVLFSLRGERRIERNRVSALYYPPYKTWFVVDENDREEIEANGGVGSPLIMVAKTVFYGEEPDWYSFDEILILPEADQQLFLNQILLGDTQ